MADVTTDNVALAKRALGYFESGRKRELGDYESLFDLMADDVVWRLSCAEETPVFAREWRGKDAVIRFFTVEDPGQAEDVEIVGPVEFFGNGDRVVVVFSQSYRIKRNGRRVENRASAILIDFRDGLITGMLEIQDLSELNLAHHCR